MRLGEIKQKIDRVVDENKNIFIKSEPKYEGRAQLVENYYDLIDVLEYVSQLEWSEVSHSEIVDGLISKYPKNTEAELLPQDEFNKLSSYINRINQKIQLYYSILDSMVERQHEFVINIKLPDKIGSLDDLNKFNKSLETLFKSFQIDGQFEFHKFDKGTSWYEIGVVGALTYNYFIACLKLAQEYFKLQTEYFKSKEAKISFETAKIKKDDLAFGTYQQEWLQSFIREEIKNLVNEKIKETNGEAKDALQSKLIIATTKLIKELGDGAEFHLSLNPPEYASEQAGQLVIDYKKIQSIKPREEVKKIENKKMETETGAQ
jgi:hypothetical protein